MTTTTVTYTPWGWTRDIEELAEGVWRVWTPSHGGLKLSRECWDSLPAALRDAMYTQTFAEEDCEEPIVRTLLGLGDDREREMALKVAGYFDRYAPALPYLRDCPPGIHYHAIAFSGRLYPDGHAYGHAYPDGRAGAGGHSDAFAETSVNRRQSATLADPAGAPRGATGHRRSAAACESAHWEEGHTYGARAEFAGLADKYRHPAHHNRVGS